MLTAGNDKKFETCNNEKGGATGALTKRTKFVIATITNSLCPGYTIIPDYPEIGSEIVQIILSLDTMIFIRHGELDQ